MSTDAPRYNPTIDIFHDHSLHLWAIAIAFYGAGDLLTTLIGLQLEGIAEIGPVAALVVNGGGSPAMIGLKIGAFLFFVMMWRLVPKPHNIGVPLALASLGVVLTIWNLAVILVLFV